MNTDYDLDTTAEAVQKAVRTVTLIVWKSYGLYKYIKSNNYYLEKNKNLWYSVRYNF